jgi:AraC-like DNA-binding protein
MNYIESSGKNDVMEGDANADFQINITPVERILRRTPLVGAGEYRCPTDHPQFAGGGPEKCPFIVFSQSSVRLVPSRGMPEVCTPNTVNFLDVGDSYERRPVSKEGAICDWVALAPALLREIAEDVDPVSADRGPHIFDRAVAPISPKIFLAQRTFFNSLQRDPNISLLAIEESAIQLVTRVLDDTAKFSRKQIARKAKSHRLAAVRRREMVEETKCILAREYWDNISIAKLAERVHCSPGYLSRSFTRLSGFTLHSYQQQLRLRAALQLIPEARFNGAGIASQLGFANHSHLSDVFKRQFGITPKDYARIASRASLEVMHAILAAIRRSSGNTASTADCSLQ